MHEAGKGHEPTIRVGWLPNRISGMWGAVKPGNSMSPLKLFYINQWRLSYLHRPSLCDNRRSFFLVRRIEPGLRWYHRRATGRCERCRAQFANWVLRANQMVYQLETGHDPCNWSKRLTLEAFFMCYGKAVARRYQHEISVYLLPRKKSIRTLIPSLARPVLELASIWSTLAYLTRGLDDVFRTVLLCWKVAS